MPETEPPENMALARSQLHRGENPPVNTTAMLVMALDRLAGYSDWTAVEVIPCTDTPYRCDGFDPADWPGGIPDFSPFRFLNHKEDPDA